MKILKIIGTATIATQMLFAVSTTQEKISSKIIKQLSNNIKQANAIPGEIKLIEVKELTDKWTTYRYKVDFNYRGKDITRYAELYSNGKYFSQSMRNLNDGSIISEKFIKSHTPKPKKKNDNFTLDESYYNDTHLILGSKNAKHKVTIFSDPLCPACTSRLPSMLKRIENKKDIALYYYSFPLKGLHPAAVTITKAYIFAKMNNLVPNKDFEYKLYSANFRQFAKSKSQPFSRENDEQFILDKFNQVFHTKINLADINSKKVNKRYNDEITRGNEIQLRGTPTVIVDGKKTINGKDAAYYLDTLVR